MKNMKERKFVKIANEVLKEEVMISKIIILESGSTNKQVDYVMYRDRFGREYQINKRNGIYTKNEYKRGE